MLPPSGLFHIFFLTERPRSPSGHLVTRRGGTHCSDFHFGCSAVPFPVPNRLFLRRIRPHQRPGGSSYFPIRTSAFTLAPLVARSGGTPCWTRFFHFSVRKERRGRKMGQKCPKSARQGRSRPFWADFSSFFRPGAVARAFLHHFSLKLGAAVVSAPLRDPSRRIFIS